MKFDKLSKQALDYWFLSKERIFTDFKKNTPEFENKNHRRIFIDRGSDILFIAHLDTVLLPQIKTITAGRIYAQGLDDRLGCYTAYKLSKKLGVDLLITDNEETAQSTAQYHTCKNYNWIVEFDRAGCDVVSYGIDNPAFLKVLNNYFEVGVGSFTDICFLDTKSCCVNIGIGYYKAHAKNSYVDLDIYDSQIETFLEFFSKHKTEKFVVDEGVEKTPLFKDYSVFPAYEEGGLLQCEWCGEDCYREDLKRVGGLLVCDMCVEDVKDYNYSCAKDEGEVFNV